MKNILEMADIPIKSKWLDLGCGSGKLLRNLNNFTIKSYVGIDYDMLQLVQE